MRCIPINRESRRRSADRNLMSRLRVPRRNSVMSEAAKYSAVVQLGDGRGRPSRLSSVNLAIIAPQFAGIVTFGGLQSPIFGPSGIALLNCAGQRWLRRVTGKFDFRSNLGG